MESQAQQLGSFCQQTFMSAGSSLYDQAGYGPPYPSDYVPRERRRLVTGGA